MRKRNKGTTMHPIIIRRLMNVNTGVEDFHGNTERDQLIRAALQDRRARNEQPRRRVLTLRRLGRRVLTLLGTQAASAR